LNAATVSLDESSPSSSNAIDQPTNDVQVTNDSPKKGSYGVDYVFNMLINESIQNHSHKVEFSGLVFHCKHIGKAPCPSQGEEVKQEFISGDPGLRKIFTFFFKKNSHLFSMSIKLSQRSKLREMTALMESMDSVLKKGSFKRSTVRSGQSSTNSGNDVNDCSKQMRRKIKAKQQYLRTKKKNILLNMKHIIGRITSYFDVVILPNTTSNNFTHGIKSIYKEFKEFGFAKLLQIIEYKSCLVKVEESYTSKICLNCLKTNEIGAAESYVCNKCPVENRITVDRDESASQAIYFRTVHRFSL